MVPLIFEQYAADMARRAVSLAPTRVLETASGTGVVTRVLVPQLQPAARYVATDLNQPMLDFAASRQVSDPRITWRQADALALPFDDAGFDLVCCQFGVMFFPDRVAGYREVKRVLSAGGHFVFNVWDRIEENGFANDVSDALAVIFANDPPQFMARTPHGYYDTELIRSDLGKAGFGEVGIETLAAQSHAASPQVAATAYCQGTPLRNEIEARAPGELQAITDRVATILADKYGQGDMVGQIQAHVILAAA